MAKKALITGIYGQDGAYLARLLVDKGYDVYGGGRRSSGDVGWRLRALGIENEVHVLYMDMLELTNIIRIIEKTRPDEIYNLAAQSFVQCSFEQPILTSDINALGVARLLEAVRSCRCAARVYQASTSEMFGTAAKGTQNETTPFHPISPYGVSKLYGHWITASYRCSYAMYACSGILFNHESPLRGPEFVTRKITAGLARIRSGARDCIRLGNLNAARDWGYAKEYVEAMWLMLQQPAPDDFVIATGETHTVREFVTRACRHAGIALRWQGAGLDETGIDEKTGHTIVSIDPAFFRPAEVDSLAGDPGKAKKLLGWEPGTGFDELVGLMMEHDLRRVSGSMKEGDGSR